MGDPLAKLACLLSGLAGDRQCDPVEHHGRVIRRGAVQIAQINGDSCFLTSDPDTYKYLATAMDYFSKCTKDKPLQDKLPKSVEVFA